MSTIDASDRCGSWRLAGGGWSWVRCLGRGRHAAAAEGCQTCRRVPFLSILPSRSECGDAHGCGGAHTDGDGPDSLREERRGVCGAGCAGAAHRSRASHPACPRSQRRSCTCVSTPGRRCRCWPSPQGYAAHALPSFATPCGRSLLPRTARGKPMRARRQRARRPPHSLRPGPPPPPPAVAPDQEALRQKLQAARDLLPRVQVPRDLKLKIRWGWAAGTRSPQPASAARISPAPASAAASRVNHQLQRLAPQALELRPTLASTHPIHAPIPPTPRPLQRAVLLPGH